MDNIVPQIIPEIEIIAWRDTYLISIRAYPSSTRPHYYKKQGVEVGVYVRVGSTNRHADKETIAELQRIIQNQTFDEQPFPVLSSEVIDFRAASEQFKSIKHLSLKDLETLELVTIVNGKKVPTIAGLILFSKEREKYFPDIWIQAGRFAGKDKNVIIDTAAFHSYPIQAIADVIQFIEKHSMQRVKIDALRHEKAWSVPFAAIREAIINAVVHADYSQKGSPIRIAIFDDRIEIENPGLLRFGLTITDIKQGISKLRNRVIGRIFNIIGLIERWGSGIQRIINTSLEHGLEEPKFEELATHFRVTIFITPIRKNIIHPVNQKILNVLAQHNNQGLTTKKIAEEINLSTRSTRTRLLKLIEMRMVVEIASSEQDPNRQYFLNSVTI